MRRNTLFFLYFILIFDKIKLSHKKGWNMPYDLHGDSEHSRETLWARKEDAKILEAMRRKLQAEADMARNVLSLKELPQS